MLKFKLSPAAELDVECILIWTEATFGMTARQRYELLLAQAIADVATNPFLLGACHRPELSEELLSFHLFHSRNHVQPKSARVKRPRHILIYRIQKNGVVEISRILQERMDLLPQIPSDFSDG